MQFKDYYKILGVKPTAELKEIKTAYRKLARKYHPDVSEHHEAEDRFKELAEAYEVLKSKEKRAEYDELRSYGRHGQPFQPPPDWQPSSGRYGAGASSQDQGFSDFFSSLFGAEGAGSHQNRGGFHMRGQDIETDLPIFLEDTLTEESKSISYQLGGVQKTLKVKIPAGVTEGERIRLKGQGAPGIGDAPSGDLYLRIRLVPHPLFDVEGHNLIVTVPLAPWEAALGAKMEVPTLAGKIQLTIPANSQSGQRLRIKNKGLISKVGQGDLYAVLKVVMPETSNKEIDQIWQQLSKQASFDPRSDWRNAS